MEKSKRTGDIMKTVVSVVGIRPDYIRMSEVFKRLDENFNHIIINTGQHFDRLLCDIFFEEMDIRKPDYNLRVGAAGKTHYEQLADVTVKLLDLIKTQNIEPDIILFLGDSNSVTASVSLAKEGYRVGHIEAGMRSYDRRMLEEINRVVCDHCSNTLFVYHENYKKHLLKEGITENVYVVGNTIVEPCNIIAKDIMQSPKENRHILVDIHRPENFKYPERMKMIFTYANFCGHTFNKPIKMLNFKRTTDSIKQYGLSLDNIELVDLMSYKTFLKESYHSLFTINDSGSAQEEQSLLGTPVIVPRDFTERPESVDHNCSFMVNMNSANQTWADSISYLKDIWNNKKTIDSTWLGDGRTSYTIAEILKATL